VISYDWPSSRAAGRVHLLGRRGRRAGVANAARAIRPCYVRPMEPRTVVVIGAGFSGTLAAAHLLRQGIGAPLRVVLVNRSGPIARGVAYGTRSEAHVLNVPAGRMSAFPDDEGSFLRFARRHDPAVTGGSFVPRHLYGQYLEEVLREAARDAAPGAVLEHGVGDATAITPADGGRAEVRFGGGRAVLADRVILAVGNYAPADPHVADSSFFASPRYVRDPWLRGALGVVGARDPVLLVGTGLTTVDIALELWNRGVRAPMHAVSRRGLLPQPHRVPGAPPTFAHAPPDIATGPATARHYLASVRRHIRRLAAQGEDWREVIGSLRPITPALWRRLDVAERARFLRHVRPYWEVVRHRVAPAPAAAFAHLVETGALMVHQGRLARFDLDDDGVAVTIQPRGRAEPVTLRVAWVINCTGPSCDLRSLHDPLIDSLLARGLLRPDPLALGLEVSDDLALIDAAGAPSQVLYYVGPLLKARDWEATAVPELRVHAAHVAQVVARSLQGRARPEAHGPHAPGHLG
jgi:uncharacterized NAD(P)/FAD-binding protein YdhS